MIRNFTQDNQNRVTRLFVAINPDNNDEIATQAQRIRGKYSRALGCIGGSSLIEAIIRDNRQMAAMKRSAAQRLGVNFSNMVALDKPYDSNVYHFLPLLNNNIAALSDANNAGIYAIKSGGATEYDRWIRYIACAGVTSAGRWRNTSLDDVNAKIDTISEASQGGYNAAKDSTDPDVFAAYKSAEDAIKAEEKAKGKELSPEEKDHIFAYKCAVSTVKVINDYGEANAEKLSYDQTIDTFEYLLYTNHKRVKNQLTINGKDAKDVIKENRIERGQTTDLLKQAIKATSKNEPQCAGYVFNGIIGKNVSKYKDKSPLGQHLYYGKENIDGQIGNTTTPQFAWVCGTKMRDNDKVYNDGKLGRGVSSMISIANDGPIEYKLYGAKCTEDNPTGIKSIPNSDQFTYEEQYNILREANGIKKNDLAYVGGKGSDGILRDRNIDMHHVVSMCSDSTYIGQNTAQVNASVYDNYIQPNNITPETKERKDPHRMYFVNVNTDEEATQYLDTKYSNMNVK